MAESLKVCVAGVGAVGSTIAARLAGSGISVNLLTRGARLQQLRTAGLRVDFDAGRLTHHLPVSDRPEFGVQDLLCLAVKAQALPALLPTLAPLIGTHTRILPLVNGIPWWYFQGAHGAGNGDAVIAVDPDGRLRDALSADRIVGSVVYITARLGADGTVTATGTQRMAIGDIVESVAAAAVTAAVTASRVQSLFSVAGLATSLTTHIRAELWTKVALNLATNPLSVITEATLVEQFTDPLLIPLVTAVLAETGRLAAAHGVGASRSLDEMLETGRQAGPFQTSMLQDYLAGRDLEIDAIGHAVLELAAKIGMEMPTTRLMIGLCTHRAARRVRVRATGA